MKTLHSLPKLSSAKVVAPLMYNERSRNVQYFITSVWSQATDTTQPPYKAVISVEPGPTSGLKCQGFAIFSKASVLNNRNIHLGMAKILGTLRLPTSNPGSFVMNCSISMERQQRRIIYTPRVTAFSLRNNMNRQPGLLPFLEIALHCSSVCCKTKARIVPSALGPPPTGTERLHLVSQCRLYSHGLASQQTVNTSLYCLDSPSKRLVIG
jgi:hypothetical protein